MENGEILKIKPVLSVMTSDDRNFFTVVLFLCKNSWQKFNSCFTYEDIMLVYCTNHGGAIPMKKARVENTAKGSNKFYTCDRGCHITIVDEY
jgi:hypothetical protein